MRVVTDRIGRIGANARVVFVLLFAATSFHCSIGIAPPDTPEIAGMADTMQYTKKTWHVKVPDNAKQVNRHLSASGSLKGEDGVGTLTAPPQKPSMQA